MFDLFFKHRKDCEKSKACIFGEEFLNEVEGENDFFAIHDKANS